MFIWAIILVFILITAYWISRWRNYPAAVNKSISASLLAIILTALLVLLYLDRMDRTYVKDEAPILISLAIDVSLSMGVMPDPRNHAQIGTRLDRVKKVLLPILEALDASGAKVMISVVGFTARPEIILGWDDNLSQVREVVEYVIAPGLLTDPGSDLGAMFEGIVPLFENLPIEYREQENKQFLIVVSDGEQTLERADLATAIGNIRARGVNIITLQAGLKDIPEGLPVYDEIGAFMGFQNVSGQMYSVPDFDIMSMIAGSEPDEGLYTRAEESGVASQISDYMGIKMSTAVSSNPVYLITLLILSLLGFVILLRFV